MEQQPTPTRLYKAWKGRNIFFCGGRLIFGPDVASFFLTIVLISGPAIAFASQMVVKIYNHQLAIKNGGPAGKVLGFPVLIVTIVITMADLLFLILTSSRDPGIVPRNTQPPESEEMSDIVTPSMEWVHGRTPHLKLPRTKDVIVNGFAVKVKYCDTCLLYRPPRASHCSICNNCVQRFDHHCPWVGQCIGLRNYRFFFLFISTSTFLCIYVFVFSWLNIFYEKTNYNGLLWRSMKGEVISLVLIAYTFVSVWFVGGLTVFHTYLISTNQSTYENFRYHYDKNVNPYNMGVLRNFKELFLSRIPPSMNDFRSWVMEEPSDSGYSSNSGIGLSMQKESIDIETGNKNSLGGKPIPDILQILDYSFIDDNIKDKLRQDGTTTHNPYSFSGTLHSNPQGSKDFDHSIDIDQSFSCALQATPIGSKDFDQSIEIDQRDMDFRIDDRSISGTADTRNIGILAFRDGGIHSQKV